MKTTIKYEVDKNTLENAVRNCIYNGISPTKIKNIKTVIQKMVYENGLSAIRFPEHWGVTDKEINYFPQSKIDEIVSKLYGRIN